MASALTKLEPQKDISNDPDVQAENTATADHAQIALRAYQLWQARGCPIGSPELDWLQAEEQLRMARSSRINHRPFIELEQRGDIGIVRISGRFATGADYEYVATKTRAIKSLSSRNLIADICELDSIGSEGIGFFVELHASITKKSGGRFVLAGPTPRVLEVLTMMRLPPIIRIAANLEAALDLCA